MSRKILRGAVPALALFLGAALVGTAFAETRVGGTIASNTVWSKDGSPYVAYEDIVVPAGRTLTIEPGVNVRFKANINDQHGTNNFDLEILVEGSLVAHGAESDTVMFTSDAVRISWQDWQGIVVAKGGSVDLRAVGIQFANEGVRVNGGHVTIRDSAIRNCDQAGVHFNGGTGTLTNVVCERVGNFGGTGIGVWLDNGAQADIVSSFLVGCQNGVSYSRGSTGSLEYSVVSLSTGKGVIVRNSTPSIRNTSVTGNEWGVEISGGAAPTITNNNLFNNGVADVWIRDYRKEIVQLDLSGNFWGTQELTEVEEQVLDGIDNPAEKAFAVLEPYLSEAVTTDKAFDERAKGGANKP